MESRLRTATQELTDATVDTIGPSLAALDAALTAAGRDGQRDAVLVQLTSLLDNEVRPLSDRLAIEVGASLAELPEPVSVPGRAPWPARFSVSRGIKPFMATLLVTAVSTPTAVNELSAGQALGTLIGLLGWGWLLLTWLKCTFSRLKLPTFLTIVLVGILHAVAGGLTSSMLRAVGFPISQGAQFAGIVACFLVGITIAMLVITQARRAVTETELERVVKETEIAAERIRRRVRLTRRQLAQVLHGALQGALYSAAAKLADAEQISMVEIDEIRSDISKALARLDVDSAAPEVGRTERTLAEIAGMWGERRVVRSSIAVEAGMALAVDGDADAACAEVVREAVTNAFRHGQAQEVDFAIRVAAAGGHQVLDIRVVNDGTPWSVGAKAGLGTQTYDEMCLSWRNSEQGEQTQFEATIALG